MTPPSSEIDLRSLCLDKKQVAPPVAKVGRPRSYVRKEPFIRGPIPWNWWLQAARLRGRALHVASALWRQAGVTNNLCVNLTSKMADELGLDRHAKARALQALEEAGLVSVQRTNGKNPKVTIINAYASRDDQTAAPEA